LLGNKTFLRGFLVFVENPSDNAKTALMEIPKGIIRYGGLPMFSRKLPVYLTAMGGPGVFSPSQFPSPATDQSLTNTSHIRRSVGRYDDWLAPPPLSL
jgi:hypothetical protein